MAKAASADAIRQAFTKGGAAEAEKKAGPVGTGWATLRGRFKYVGDPPTPKPYDVTKEPEICKTHPQETLVVDPSSKGIKNVAVYLRDATRRHESAEPTKDMVVFDQKECVFKTHVVGVTVGQTLDIKNSDPIGHNTNIVGTGFNPTVPADGAIPFAVQKETAVPNEVKCGIHPWMTAYMLARKDKYFAITDAQGNFEIANLPAGEPLKIQIWHESGAAAGGAGLVGTTPNAKDVKWTNRGILELTLQPDEKREIEFEVPAKAFRG